MASRGISTKPGSVWRGEVAENVPQGSMEHSRDPACADCGPVLCLTPLKSVHMINWILKKIIGSKNTRLVKSLRPTVARINELEVEYQKLSDEQLPAKTAVWKERLAKIDDENEQQVVLNEILPEAFALVKNAARRLCGRTFQVCDQPY